MKIPQRRTKKLPRVMNKTGRIFFLALIREKFQLRCILLTFSSRNTFFAGLCNCGVVHAVIFSGAFIYYVNVNTRVKKFRSVEFLLY